MSFVIASQLERATNAILANHASRPTFIMAPERDPWSIARQADVLIVRPTPAWRNAPRDVVPPGWPGRLRWVFSCSVGVDFYPGWLLDGPPVSCARGTASEEIADYVIAAMYARAKDLSNAAVRSPQDWRYRELGRVVDSTVGVIGLGAIGTAVARRAAAQERRRILETDDFLDNLRQPATATPSARRATQEDNHGEELRRGRSVAPQTAFPRATVQEQSTAYPPRGPPPAVPLPQFQWGPR